MAILSQAIAAALAPGIALTASIFYNSSLQNRFIYITGRMRELNREARQIGASDEPVPRARMESLRRQVGLMAHRTRILRRAILTAYLALIGFVLSIILLLLVGLTGWPAMEVTATFTFGLALALMAIAAGISWTENLLSKSTIIEDVRSSFGDLPEPP